MTIQEVQQRFDLELRKYQKDPVMSTIVEDYINYAYQDYITKTYDSIIASGIHFEINERVSRILAPILVDFNTVTFAALTTNGSNCYTTTITGASTLQYLISEKAVINTTDCDGTVTTKTCKIIPMKHNMIRANLLNPFLNPNDDDEEAEIWRVNISTGRLEFFIPSGTTLASYTCRFIKKQTPFSLNPTAPATGEMEIDSSVHGDIAVMAVAMYLNDLRNNNVKQEQNV